MWVISIRSLIDHPIKLFNKLRYFGQAAGLDHSRVALGVIGGGQPACLPFLIFLRSKRLLFNPTVRAVAKRFMARLAAAAQGHSVAGFKGFAVRPLNWNIPGHPQRALNWAT